MRFLALLTRPHHRGIKTDYLWLLIILAAIGFHASLVPLMPNDFWWHLKIGELIYTTGDIPATNLFAWTLPANQPFVYGAWLGEYLFYLLFRAGGMALVVTARTVLVLLTFWMVGYEAQRRTGSWRLAAFVVAVAYVMTLNNVVIRPQNWSWLPFVATLMLLSRYAGGQLPAKWLWVLPAMMLFWVNVHGAFVLELVLIGAFFAGEVVTALLKLPDALSWPKIRWLAIIGVATLLATLVNPLGAGIFGYVMNLMDDQPSQTLIMEWQPPTPQGIANSVFFVTVLVLLVLLWMTPRRPRPTQVLLLAGFLWLAWSGVRYVIWFGLVAMPLLAEVVAAVVGQRRWLVGTAAKNLLNVLIGLLVFVPVLFVQPWFPGFDVTFLPETYQALVWRDTDIGPYLSVRTPIAVTEYLEAHPGGRLFHEMAYGSYFIWALPAQGVFIDPRVELYPYEQWQDYIHIVNGVRYNKILDEYGVDRLVLDVEYQKELLLSLTDDPTWQQVYADDYSEVWAKCPGPFCE